MRRDLKWQRHRAHRVILMAFLPKMANGMHEHLFVYNRLRAVCVCYFTDLKISQQCPYPGAVCPDACNGFGVFVKIILFNYLSGQQSLNFRHWIKCPATQPCDDVNWYTMNGEQTLFSSILLFKPVSITYSVYVDMKHDRGRCQEREGEKKRSETI